MGACVYRVCVIACECACVCVGVWVGGWVGGWMGACVCVSTQTSPAPVRNKFPIKTNHAYHVDGPFLFLTAYPVRAHTHTHTRKRTRARARALPQHKRPLRAESRNVPSEICHPARNMLHYLILSDTALAGSRKSGGIGCTIIVMCAFVLFSSPRATSLKARCREA